MRLPSLERTSRRALKAIYWTLTLQLPRRLRERRPAQGSPTDDRARYRRWIELYDTIDHRDVAAIRRLIASLKHEPLLSVLVSVHDVPDRLLRRALDSVIGQVYETWELCVAHDASSDPHVRRLLEEYAAGEPRVKLVRLAPRRGISFGSHAALEHATGRFVVLLGQDGVLPPHALFMVAWSLDQDPDAVVLYSDEDSVDADGERHDPYFKSDWNVALALSQNYLNRLSAFRRDRALALGGFRPQYEGSHDWDLLLRLTRGLPPAKIAHIPHVLYHAHAVETSAVLDEAASSDAVAAATRAVADYLRDGGVDAPVDVVEPGFQRVRYAVPDPAPAVDVIVPTACAHDWVEPYIHRLLEETSYPNLRVTLVVSESVYEQPEKAGVLERLSGDLRVDVLQHERRSFNYAWLNNQAIARTSAGFLCLMNDDVRVIQRDWLNVMVGHVVQKDVAAVGSLLYYPDDTVQHGGIILGAGGVADHYHRALPAGEPGYFGRAILDQDLSCVTAGCMLLRRDAFVDAGGFDEVFAVAFNDVDLCLRLRERGWRIVWTPAARLYHQESISVGPPESAERAQEFDRERKLLVERWGETLRSDPYYNPNLSLEYLNELAFPPRITYPWKRDREEERSRVQSWTPTTARSR